MATFPFNFKKQFVPAVQSGAKHQTIRQNRRDGRRPVPGDTIKAYTGLRTAHCQLIVEATCTRCRAVRIDTASREIVIDGMKLGPAEALAFAQADGFDSVASLRDFFHDNYMGATFEGFCVEWTQ